MNIIVRGKNIDVTDALREYVEKKVGRLEKLLDHIREAQVSLSAVKGRHIVEVTLYINGITMRGEEETNDMYASIDLVTDKLERQIRKYKTKINRKLRAGGHEVVDTPFDADDVEENKPKIVRTKRFAFKPLPVEEAIMQMNLLGHNFFVFTNAETEKVNVVYQRRNGDYGLIEPEY